MVEKYPYPSNFDEAIDGVIEKGMAQVHNHIYRRGLHAGWQAWAHHFAMLVFTEPGRVLSALSSSKFKSKELEEGEERQKEKKLEESSFTSLLLNWHKPHDMSECIGRRHKSYAGWRYHINVRNNKRIQHMTPTGSRCSWSVLSRCEVFGGVRIAGTQMHQPMQNLQHILRLKGITQQETMTKGLGFFRYPDAYTNATNHWTWELEHFQVPRRRQCNQSSDLGTTSQGATTL